jgi:hypothetical protein
MNVETVIVLFAMAAIFGLVRLVAIDGMFMAPPVSSSLYSGPD